MTADLNTGIGSRLRGGLLCSDRLIRRHNKDMDIHSDQGTPPYELYFLISALYSCPSPVKIRSWDLCILERTPVANSSRWHPQRCS
jgi:hypothetical protein